MHGGVQCHSTFPRAGCMEAREAEAGIPLRDMASEAQYTIQREEVVPQEHSTVGTGGAVGFFILGLLNNLPYVVILTAAIELLPSHVPTGLLAFVNIAPALLAKAIFPYFLKGEIWYAHRVVACVSAAFSGMLVRASSYPDHGVV